MMRTILRRTCVLVGLSTLALPAGAQTSQPTAKPETAVMPGTLDVATLDFGVQLTGTAEDPARYHRYRDLRSGPLVNLFRFERQRDTWGVSASAERVGFRDQRYSASVDWFGKLGVSFDFDGVPEYLSRQAATLYTADVPGVLRLDDALQAAVQGGANYQTFAGAARPFELRTQRNTSAVRLWYLPTEALDLRVGYRSSTRSGNQPFGGSFGLSFTTELPAPTEDRTDELSATAEWSNGRAMARVGYDGSWYRNDVPSLTWDNPNRLTDQVSTAQTGIGGAQGRMARWPDSTAHTVSAMGTLNLSKRTRAHGYVSLGTWIQDERLLPFTINTAIPTIALDRQTADAEARVLSMNWGVNSRPHRDWWLTARVRYYDFDNRTPHFAVPNFVRVDQTVSPSAVGESEPFEYTRNFLDLDASYTGLRHLNLRAGYGRQHDDRAFRFFEKTTEHTVRFSADSTDLSWASARLLVERSKRTGEGLDEEVFGDIDEQVSLRQFDISDRDRTRVSAIFQVTPMSMLGISATIGTGRDTRPDAYFGVQHLDNNFFAVGVDAVPRDDMSFGVEYGFETYDSLQRSRQANPGVQFDDPTRDWQADADEKVHTFTASMDLSAIAPNTALRAAYNASRSRARYLYVLPPNTTLAAPQQLTPVRNDIQELTLDLRYTLSQRNAVALGYWFDHYDVQDFALSPDTIGDRFYPTIMMLGYMWKPYTIHTVSARYIYQW
jgi:MtrB/PioB family decaheme-associated outer membrane protein